MSALASYRAMMREVVGPALRAAGLRGSRGCWYLRGPDHRCGWIEIRSSTSSSRSQVQFRVVVAAARAADPAEQPGRAPRVEDAAWRAALAPASPLVARFRGDAPGWWSLPDSPHGAGLGPILADLLVEVAVPRLQAALGTGEPPASHEALRPLGPAED